MRLSKITLCGFKSFADRTEVSFEAPVTGIVAAARATSSMP
jgi:chromosome segregation ATPase